MTVDGVMVQVFGKYDYSAREPESIETNRSDIITTAVELLKTQEAR